MASIYGALYIGALYRVLVYREEREVQRRETGQIAEERETSFKKKS